MPCNRHPHPWVPYVDFRICECETICSFCLDDLQQPETLVKHVYSAHACRPSKNYKLFESLFQVYLKRNDVVREQYITSPCTCDDFGIFGTLDASPETTAPVQETTDQDREIAGEQPAPQPDQPALQPDQPIPQPDQPVPQPDQPVPQPDQPVPQPDQPAPQSDQPTIRGRKRRARTSQDEGSTAVTKPQKRSKANARKKLAPSKRISSAIPKAARVGSAGTATSTNPAPVIRDSQIPRPRNTTGYSSPRRSVAPHATAADNAAPNTAQVPVETAATFDFRPTNAFDMSTLNTTLPQVDEFGFQNLTGSSSFLGDYTAYQHLSGSDYVYYDYPSSGFSGGHVPIDSGLESHYLPYAPQVDAQYTADVGNSSFDPNGYMQMSAGQFDPAWPTPVAAQQMYMPAQHQSGPFAGAFFEAPEGAFMP